MGIADHLGWAVAVTADDDHEVVDRRRIELVEAGVSPAPIHYLLPDRADFEPCWPVLRRAFGSARPAATMQVCGLSDPRMRIEIEVTARRADCRTC